MVRYALELGSQQSQQKRPTNKALDMHWEFWTLVGSPEPAKRPKVLQVAEMQ